MISALFWLFFMSASAIIVLFGRSLERSFLIALIACVVATYIFNAKLGWNEAQPYILIVDCALLALALFITSKANNFWPIWFSAFQGIAVATSLAQIVFPNEIPGIYINIKGLWFFPALISVVVGTLLDHRQASAKNAPHSN
jgi:hypothetical protein